jgi:hypothetical protein
METGVVSKESCAYVSKMTAIISTKRPNDFKKEKWVYSDNRKTRLTSTKDFTSTTEIFLSQRNNWASISAKGERDLNQQKGK